MKLNYIIVMVLLSFCFAGWAQQKTVTGTVIDEQGIPLAGTNILEEGTTNGAQADFDGNFTINVEENAILVFSYIGMLKQSISTAGKTTIKITLFEDAAQLDEVVVVGYGSQKKVNLTGSVSVVKAEEITKQPVAQASQALAGLVPGLTVTQNSGQPGADDATLRIRGIGTLGNGRKNDPLVLVDGIPDNINGVDPNDIESISVLKDAAAAAIYGSRGANGVILVTTKRGKEGVVTTTYNTYVGFQSPAQQLDFLGSLGYMEAFNDAIPGSFDEETLEKYRNGSGVGTEKLPDTDWVDLIFSRSGLQMYHSVGVNAGTDKLKLGGSISYLDQEGNVPGYEFKRYSGRFNSDIKISNKLDVAFDLNFRREIRDEPRALENTIRQAYRYQPLFVAVNDDGSWGPGFNGNNPLAIVNSTSLDRNITNYFRAILKATYKPIDELAISLSYSPQYTDRDRDAFIAGYIYKENSDAEPNTELVTNNSLNKSTSEVFIDNFNFLVNFNKSFGDHSLTALAGYESIKTQSENWGAFRRTFVVPEFRTLNNGNAESATNRGSATLFGLESVFGRLNYTYNDKYLLEANVRRDASSRFAASNRAQTFPSFSAGWVISNEGFFPENDVVTFLKIRSSWGQLGNQEIFTTDANGNPVAENFIYASQFGIGNADTVLGGASQVGGAQTQLANPLLVWETGENFNVGLDVNLFSSKLKLTAEYYKRTTKDIILEIGTVAPSAGLGVPFRNAGDVTNSGIDFSLGWRDNIGDFNYGITGNFSTFNNEVTGLADGLTELPVIGNTINRVGEMQNSIFGLQSAGLYQESDFTDGVLNSDLPVPAFGTVQPGDIKYVDTNGRDTEGNLTGMPDGTINNDDRAIIGSTIANTFWGVDFQAAYKNFDFSVSFIGESGRDVVLLEDAGWSFYNAGKIQQWQTDYWTPQNTGAAYPRAIADSSSPNWRVNETYMFNGAYTRLRNLTIGYTLPRDFLDKIKLKNFRLYLSGQNLLTFDKMPDGVDPTVPDFTNGGFYPVMKIYTMGLTIGF
ncbi:TonB-dependent receptor [uncultured Algibacter sp.]|uniref:SusC/RagA family TonB-linked outer membrane protein n=1 Tax=uncultured Algibacter sp. TaxID=298659 RepID=UPI002607BADB|nr:TonB-dependent receptor [uncultured Algibacter sp.]